MELTAVFELWHLGDGNYPPFHEGQIVNLSFELEPDVPLRQSDLGESLAFKSLGSAEYAFCAEVIRNYAIDSQEDLIVLSTADFRFYICSPQVRELRHAQVVCGVGTLVLDHYSWVENLESYTDPPDLFYNLRVSRIWLVRIPERFVSRYEDGKSLPTRICQRELEPGTLKQITTMEGLQDDEAFCIVEFTDAGLNGIAVPKTFLS